MLICVDMGKVPEELKERNQSLINDYNNGYHLVDLVKKYGVTQQRIYFIVRRAKKRSRLNDTVSDS